MSWEATLSVVIVLILQVRTEKKGNETMGFLLCGLVFALESFVCHNYE